jgi:hypothetical protein
MAFIIDHTLREELEALNGMAKGALDKVKRPVFYGINPDQPAGQLARQLWIRLGPRRAAILRTKLHTLVWREAQARKGGNGHA